MEHISDDIEAMKEIYRVLVPKGWAILQVPIDYKRSQTYEDFSINTPEERLKEYGHEEHVRIYGTDYPERLKSVGFKVNEINLLKELSENDIFRYGFLKENIYQVFKN